jgi:hypothetical protein
MMRDGVCSVQSMPAHLTSGTESGLLPTPLASLGTNGGPNQRDSSGRPDLQMAAMMWPTPCATDHKGSGKTGELRDRLDYAVERGGTKSKTYATPQARDFRSGSTDRWDDPERSRNLNDQIGGQLNPTWVEWLMGWPLFWTSLDINVKPYYDSWHEAQQWTQASSEEIQGNIVRNVWWDIDPATTSHGREPDQQSGDKCDDRLPTVPHEDPLFNRELGAGEYQADGLQDLRRDVQAQTRQKVNALWQAGMPEGKRETIGRVAMGVKNRVDRLKAIGNGQVSAVAALAWRTLTRT